MDSTKTAIKSLVLDLRKSLEADIEVGLRRYGITPTALRPVDTLKHLDDRGITARIRMEEAIHHEMERATDSKQTLAEAVHWFVREVAFTHLNRLVGLKAMEVRGLVPEVIQTRAEYGNRSRMLRDYREAHPEAASLPDDGLEAAIQEACRQVYPEFRLLFDVGDPAEMRDAPTNSLLFPSTPTLKACINSINELDAKIGRSGAPAHGKATPEQSMWAEDEIIGWVYQFFTKEEKSNIRDRDNRLQPRHPIEVAVLNQFFTRRWAVKFLVDNTLGRLWLEMHPNSTRVRTKCDYLVPEPAPTGSVGLDPDSPINNPDAAPRRGAKRPQDIRLIDPACGTMHFGHYAFEVFQEIYADAREHGWVKGADALSDDDVPAAILQNNLFGVDIDLRAVQLAALSLFMKAKSANPDARVGQVNLIVANAHLPQGKVRTDFLAQYASEPVIQKAFQEVFESLENVAEVGSLLRVEERFRQALSSGGFQSKTPTKKKKDADGQQAAFAEIAPGWSLEHTVEQMLVHLREFARRALQEHDLNAQLFAAETEKSVALLDVFLHEYDVVVMNPPFGMSLPDAHVAIDSMYPSWGDNLLCAFYIRAEAMVQSRNGYIGMVADKTITAKRLYSSFRLNHLLNSPKMISFLDLGWEFLDDANVEVCAFVTSIKKTIGDALFVDLQGEIEQESTLKNIISELNIDATTNLDMVYWRNMEDFTSFPLGALGYKAPESALEAFRKHPKLSDTVAYCPAGGMNATSEQYYRYWWEVSKNRIGNHLDFAPLWNGFAGHSPFYMTDENVILWYKNGNRVANDPRTNMRITERYFTPGLKWGKRGDILDVALFNGGVFSVEGQALFLNNDQYTWSLLGFLNSYFAQFLINLFAGQHKYGSYLGQLPYAPRLLEDKLGIDKAAQKIYKLKADWDKGNETNLEFDLPWLIQARNLEGVYNKIFNGKKPSDLGRLIEGLFEYENQCNENIINLQNQIDNVVFNYYDVTQVEQQYIRDELSRRPPTELWSYAANFSEDEKSTEHVARLISYCLLESLHVDSDGILPITEASGGTNVLRQIQAQLETHFGEQAAYQVELDSATYLGRPLGEWLLKNFWKDFHVRWYKSRPLLWQLQSQKGHFACILHIHKLDRDTLPKIRTQYLWSARNACQASLESARLREDTGDRSAAKEVAKLEAMLEDLNDFEQRLTSVIEGRVKCKIPAWAQGPYRNGIYDPVLDDGVAVNILPLQEAGLLAKAKVV